MGFEPREPLDSPARDALRDLFDRRGLLLFRDLDIDHPYQVDLTTMLIRKGDLTDVALTTVERPPATTTEIGRRRPRTGQTILYVCEQMTKEVVGMAPDESEHLLQELFAHLYDPANRWDHQWRDGDLVGWNNQAVQHARPNVQTDGPARTLRKVAFPIPRLRPDELPTYSSSQ